MPAKKEVKVEKPCCDGACSGKCMSKGKTDSGSAVYGIGMIGAIVYFWQHAATLTDYLMGVVKSFVWPAMLVYKALELLKF